MGLTLYSGNRLEILTDEFAGTVSSAPLPVMTKETVVLQSMGMMKWLTVEMSRRLGIWSNYEYIFPNKMAGRILNSFFPGRGDERFFDKDLMTWKCMDIILREKGNPFFGELSQYIENDLTGIKLFQIASKIVDLFDQYMTFRPEMITGWDKGEMKGEWQAELWRILTHGMSGDHPPALLEKIYGLIAGNENFTPVNLPSRITVFGISYIPMYHLNILRAASFYSEVNLFILNPSSEYWGNILTEKEKRKIISASPLIPGDPEDYLHMEQGNTLLASLGRVGRDFLFNIFQSDLDTSELFEKPPAESLLGMIQEDIYMMRNGTSAAGKTVLSEAELLEDGSVTVNSCHSPMREVEVLHDYLLDLMNSDKTLTPGDILVMSPDIEEYSSSINGVFGRESGGVPRIPFRIADRKLKNTSIGTGTFFKILGLSEDRFTPAAVLGIAECGEIREKFNLSHEDMDTAGRWVRETGIFWGMDSRHKTETGLPGIYENTWRFGFDRMLLGSVMYGGDETTLGILPYTEIEGGDLQLLGRFITFYNSLREIYYMLKTDYTLSGWSDVINTILDMMFASDGVPDSMSSISDAALNLKKMQDESLYSGKISADVVSLYLEKSLPEPGSGKDFVSGRLTFCEMLPMRSIPCRVICILGLNDSAFPRKSRSLSFDLTSAKPKRGDRSVRDEDRYLFLETLVSARDYLYISYTGQSQSSSSLLNPSVVVSELLEYIDEFYETDSEEKRIRDYIFKTHRIQPYNPVYFIPGSGFFTYQGARRDGALSCALNKKHESRFMDKPLPPPGEDERTISINDLSAFLANPSKALLNKRLGLYLVMRSEEYKDEEPFIPDFSDQYRLTSGIMQALIQGKGRDTHFNIIKASGILPHSTPGVLAYDRAFIQVKNFYDRFSFLLKGKEVKKDINLSIDGFTLTGGADSIYNGRNIFFRYASAKGMDILRAWITHLALCADGAFKGDTLLISRNGTRGWDFIPESKKILSALLKIYEEGMMKPLPLFPGSSLKFAETFYDGRDSEPSARAMKYASAAFRNLRYGGDADDPYVKKLFGDSYTLSGDFRNITLKVYSPVFENMKKEAEL